MIAEWILMHTSPHIVANDVAPRLTAIDVRNIRIAAVWLHVLANELTDLS